MKQFLFSLAMCFAIVSFSQPISFQSFGIGGTGAMYFPKINPANDNEFYVNGGSAMFGTKDFGKNYVQLKFQSLKPNEFSTYEFTNDPKVAYSISDDGNLGYPVRTIDGGQTWTRLPGYDENLSLVWRMFANFENPKQLIMNYWEEIVISNDGGVSFKQIKRASNEVSGIVIAGVFYEGGTIYVATNEGVMRSTDQGNSFSLWATSGIPPSEVIWQFSAAKSGIKTRFMCITAPKDLVTNDILPFQNANFAQGVYIMDDTSTVWMSRSVGINPGNDFIMYTGMARNDINTLYLAGSDQEFDAPMILKSTNAGLTWSKVFTVSGNQNIATGWAGHDGDRDWSNAKTVFGLAVAPNNSQKIVLGDRNFIHISQDGGMNWNQAYVNSIDQNQANTPTPKRKYYRSIGLERMNSWQIHWLDKDNMLACVGEVGLLRSSDGGKSWGMDYTGISSKTMYRMVETPSLKLYGACATVQGLYETTQPIDQELYAPDTNGKIVRSVDNGASWATIHNFNHPVYWLTVDPNDHNTMYASVVHNVEGGIWFTTTLGLGEQSFWTKLPNPPRTEGHPSNIVVKNDGKVLCTFSSRRNTVGMITNSSGVFLYDPKQKIWTDLSDPRMLMWTKDLVIDPNDPTQNTCYVAVFDGWESAAVGNGGLYKTVDAGKNWTKVTGSMVEKATSIAFSRKNPKEAYLSTDGQGLWVSKNMDQSTPSFTEVYAYPFGHPVRMYFNPFDFNELWVTSFGNGMKMGRLDGVNGSEELAIDKPDWLVGPNPFSNSLSFSYSSNHAPALLTVHKLDGTLVAKMTIDKANTELDTKHWTDGVYVVRKGEFARKVVKISSK